VIYRSVVIGAGPAGLATSYELSRSGVAHVVLERGPEVAHSWANYYDSLVLHTTRSLSALPGVGFPSGTPTFPSRRDMVAYLRAYASHFSLPIRCGADVISLTRGPDGWIARTSTGDEYRARTAVVATGIAANPKVPPMVGREQFRGRVLHSADYHRPDEFGTSRVLVVGAGNSAGEIAAELASAGAQVTIAVRSGAHVVPLRLFGIPVQYFGVALEHVPRAWFNRITAVVERFSFQSAKAAVLPRPPRKPCDSVPIIGGHLVDAIRDGRIRVARGVTELTVDGARFDDGTAHVFDTIILATGFSAAIGLLGKAVSRDACGFASRVDRVVSRDADGLHFVGHSYGPGGSLYHMRADARRAAALIRRGTSRTSTETPPLPSER